MKKLVIFSFFLLLFSSKSFFAQGDDCSTAILVSANGCSALGAYNNTSITAGTLAPPSCFGVGNNNGMWFQFIALGPVVNITVNGGTLAAPMISLLSSTGGCVSPFTELGCSNPGTANASLAYSALTPGNVYYIYIDGANSNVGTFQLCLTSPAQPTNDSPCSPFVIPTVANFCSGANAFTNVGATSEPLTLNGNTVYLPGCFVGTSNINTVFFQYTSTGSSINVSINGTLVTPQISLIQLTGTCTASGAYNNLGCASAAAGNTASLSLANAVPGNTYLIMVDGVNANTGTFEICVNSFNPIGTVVNDNCNSATLLCPNNTYYATTSGATPSSTTGPNVATQFIGQTPINGEWQCNGVVDNDVWFSFTTTNPVTPITFSINSNCYDSPIAPADPSGGYLQFEVFERTDGLSACANHSAINNASWSSLGCSYVGPGIATAALTIPAASMLPNTQYYVVVDNFPGCSCDFNFDVTGNQGASAGTPTTVCSSGSPINMTGFSPATGGTWSGPGITNSVTGTFNPSIAGVGSHLLFFNYGPCIDTKIVNVTGPNVNLSNNISLCPGSCTTIFGDATQPQTIVSHPSASNTNSIAIPDNSPTGITSTISISGLAPGATVESVCLNINHPNDNNLDIYLVCPSGTTLELSIDNGGNGDNYTNTCFNLTSAVNITAGAAPFSSATGYTPQQSLALLNSCLANGTWSLVVIDDQNNNTGALLNWTITFLNTVINTIPATSYTWSPSAAITGSASLSPTVCPIANTAYTLTATDINGCLASDVVTVSVTPLSISLSPNQTICAGKTVTLTSTGATTYSWSPSIGLSSTSGSSVIASPTITTTYTVIGTQGACTDTKTVTVTATPAPSLTVVNSALCSGGTATISASGASTYTWSGGVTNGSVISPTVTASYTVIGTTASGCTNTAVQTISINPAPTITASASNSVICSGNSVTLNGGGASSYTWTGGVTNGGAFSPTATASYTVTGTSASGCTNTAVQTITVNPIPITTASTTGTITCTTPTITLNSTLAGVNYTWAAPSGGSISSANTQSTSVSGAAGIYTLNVQSTAGCTYSTTTSVTQNTTIPTGLSAGTNQTLTCASSSIALNGSITTPTNATVNWAGASVCGTATTLVTSACGAGVYTLTATNPLNGCIATSTVQVSPSAGAPLVTNNPVTNTITCTNTLVTVSISTSVTPVTYAWSGIGIVGTTTLSSISVSQGGTFQYTVTNTSSGCATSNNQVVIQNTTVPTTTASTSGSLTCSPSSTVNLSSTLSSMNYTWTSPSGGSVGSVNSQNTSASGAAGIYTLNIIDPSTGCSFTTTTSVSQNTTAPTTTASTSGSLTCSPSSTVSLSSTLSSMNYTWTAPSGGSVGSANSQNTSASGAAGIYTLNIIDSSTGCSFTTTTSVSQNTIVPTTTLSVSGVLTCSTLTVDLNSTLAGMNYTWTTPAPSTINTQSTTVTIAGDYTLSVLDPANGCSYTTTVSVAQNTTTPIGLSAGVNQTLTCPSNSLTLNGSITTPTNANVIWTGPSITGSTTSYTTTVNGAGIYTLTATDPVNNCIATSIVEVFPNAGSPVASITSTALVIDCNNASQSVTVTSVPSTDVTYSWNTAPSSLSSNGAIATFTNANTYICTVTNTLSNCSIPVQVVVTSNTIVPTTTLSVSGILTCSTLSVDLSSTLAGMNYTWTTPVPSTVNTQSTTATIAGDYTLSVLDPANGCSYTTTISVAQNTTTPIGLTAGANQTLTCPSNSLTLNGSITTPTNATILWTGPSITGSTNSYTTTVNGAGIYTLTATNPLNGCIATSTVEVFPNAGSPVASITSTALVIDCNSASQSVTVTSVPSTDVTYSWNTAPSSLSSDGTVATFTNANTYICTVTNTLSNCSIPVQVVVTSNTIVPTITITPTQTLTCATQTAAITLTTTPSSGLTYTWSGTLLSGQGTDFITINQTGNYTVVVTNAVNGCTNTASSQVDVDANLPNASINITSTNSVITCSNQSVDLTVNVSPLAAYNYTWSTASNATNISVTSANVYSVTVINPSTGCSAVALYTVTSNTIPPTVQTTNTIIPCNTTTVNVIATSTSAVTYSWTSTNGTLLTNGTSIVEVGSIGDYVVTVTDITNGCINTTTASVSQTTINASFTANPLSGTAPLLVDFTNTSNNPAGTIYSWNFGDLNTASTTNANNTYTLIGNYTVTLTATDAASLCTATSTINIEVIENSYISVPNVFTPNGDNANDVFKIDTRGIKDLTCEIYNRWGLKIYTLIGIKDSWDGLNQTAGTYFYILTAEGYDGKEYKQQGFISLFK